MKSSGLKKKVSTYMIIFLVVGLMAGIQKQEVQGASAAASSNAYLKSLSVDPGTMSPEFSSEVTSYTISVAEDVERISVTCSTADSKAQVVEAGGFKGLEMGDNDAVITVQAEDGTKCTYHLTITRGTATAGESTESTTESTGDTADAQENENNEAADTTETEEGEETEEVSEPVAISLDADAATIPVGGESIFAPFQVISTFPDGITVPEGFTMEDYTYKGVHVQSAYFAAGDIRLLYLTAMDGTSADFRIYYEDTDTFMDFVQFQGTDGKFIMPVRYEAQIKIPDNYTGSYLPWGDKVVACYIYTELTDNPITVAGMEEETEIEAEEAEQEPVNVEDLDEEVEFYLIYAMNNQGEENFYLYDYVEGTYQRYVERDTSYDLDQSYFKYKDIAHQRFAIMCILIVLLVLAVFCIINLYIKNRELKAELDDEEDNEDNDGEENDENEIEAAAAEEKKARKQQKKVKKEAEPEEQPEQSEQPIQPQKKVKEVPVKKEAAKETIEKQPKQSEKQPEQPETPVKEMDTSALSDLEEKIIGQLAQEEVQEEQEAPTAKEPVKPRKNATFKMINLSREPEPTGLDDDFEFEFINLDDD
jgi:cell division protein FtsL